MVVESGEQAGLVLEFLPGVLSEAVEIRVLDVPVEPGAVVDGTVGVPFRIEPASLVVDTQCRLRIPFKPAAASTAGPGNVVVRQQSPFATRTYAPDALSVVEQWVEVGIKTFGEFHALMGPSPSNLLGYTPPIGSVAMLTGGHQFEVMEEPTAAPFSAQDAQEWRLSGPTINESLVFQDGVILGRRCALCNWVEIWDEPFSPYQPTGAGFVTPQPASAEVQNPVGSPGIGGTVMPFGYYVFSEPLEFAGELELDVLKLVVDVAYVRHDLGSGERRMTFWLSPTSGLLSVMVDGVIYDRIP